MRLLISNLILLDGWRRLGLAFLAGTLASLGQPPFGLFPLLWLCLPVLVWLLNSASLGKKNRAAAVAMAQVGWMFGFGFFLCTFYWLGFAFLVEAEKFAWAMPLAILVLPAGLALFWGLATSLVSFVWTESPLRVIWLALALSMAEWLRGTILTGLPWGGFAPALASNGLMMQALSLVGPDSYTLFALMLFSLPVFLLSEDGHKSLGVRLSLCIMLIFIAQLGFGAWRLLSSKPTSQNRPVVRLVQPNIPQKEKWKFENRSWIFNRLLALTSYESEATPTKDVDLVIWPESAIPFYLIEQPGALAAIKRILPEKAGLVTGALRREPDGTGDSAVFNSIYQLARNGTVEAAYDKMHLVPFGEYLPKHHWLEAIGLEQLTAQKRGFSTGAMRHLLTIPGFGKILPLVCYEIAFPSEIRAFPQGADVIVNVTNDAWFGASAGPYQHLHLARMRAVEFGLPVVRVANTGISAIIDAKGQIVTALDLEQEGILQKQLPTKMPQTLYFVAGNWIFLTLWAVFAIATASITRKVSKADY